MNLLRVLLIVLLTGTPMWAQQTACPNTASVTVAGGNTGTAIAAKDSQTDICGFLFTGTVAGTTIQIKAGNTDLTPVLVTGANGQVSWPLDTVTWSAPAGTAITVTVGTGNATGFLTFR